MKVLNLLLCFYAIFLTSTVLGQPQYITPIWGNNFNVTLSSSPVKYNIPIELSQNIKDSLLITGIVAVKSDKTPNNIPINSIVDSGIVKINGKYFLVFATSKESAIIPATYTVDYRIKYKESPNSIQQSLPLNITFLAAEITPISTVIVGRKDPFFWFPYKVTGNRFLLTEQGRKSPLTGINIEVLKTVHESGTSIPVIVDFKYDKNVIIPPGRSLPVDFEINGDLPIGKSTTTVQLSSAELTAPVIFTIETTSRHGIVWLIFFIMLGLAVGHITRNILTKKITLSTAKLNALELIRIINQEIKNRPDQKFITAAGTMRQDLENALKKSDDVAINTVITDSKNALAAAINVHNADRISAQQMLNDLKVTINQLNKLPHQFSSIAKLFESSINDAQQANNSGDAESSKNLTDSITSKIDSLFVTTLSQYKIDVESGLSLFKNLKFPLIDFQPQVSSLLTLAANITPALQIKPNESALNQVFNVDFQIFSLLDYAGVQIASAITSAVEKINKQPLTNADAITKLTDSTNTLLAAIINSKTDPYPLFKKFATDLNDLHNRFESSFTEQTVVSDDTSPNKDQNNKDRELLKVLIEKGDYSAAADTLVKFLARNKPRDIFTDSNPAFNITNYNVSVARTLGGTTTVTSQLTTPVSDLDKFEIATVQLLHSAQYWQTLLSGIVILIIGYALYADSFVGKATEIASIFVWAFALDVSVSTIMNSLATKVIKK